MAKQKTVSAQLTNELPGLPAKRGRPFTGNAKSNAERQAAWRTRKQSERASAIEDVAGAFADTSTDDVRRMISEGGERTMRLAWQELGRRMGWLV